MNDLHDLNELIVDRVEGVYRLRFSHAIEVQYRNAARRQRRYPRTILFLLLGLCFAFGPFYETALFGVSASILPLLRIIEFVIVAPTALAAALATYFNLRNDIAYGLQTAATICIWSSSLVLRRFALEGLIHYPGSMIGISVAAVAIFSGFNWYRIAFGSIVFFLLGSYQEYELGKDMAESWIEINAFFCMTLIAVMGAYVNEVSFRLAWVNGRSAALLARTDVLTGLANRVEFNRLFPRIIGQARRENSTIAVALIDIDHFKRINDTYGHHYGDEVLKAMGKALLQGPTRRPLDINVRYGGEEMVIVWYAVSPETLPRFVEDTLSAIRMISVKGPTDDEVINITASMGVAWLKPQETVAPQSLLAFADRLMYQAKAKGRDCAVIEPYSTPKGTTFVV